MPSTCTTRQVIVERSSLKGTFRDGAQLREVERCVFSEDRLFLRRTAFVMSSDGESSSTYRTGFDGGIWQITESMFLATRNCSQQQDLSAACSSISTQLGIQWSTVQWTDLRKPLYSGLAAALYTLQTLGSSDMPGDISFQAALWARMYGEKNVDVFRQRAAMAPVFECKDKMDLMFILDSSGSVSESSYHLMKNFTASVVDVMNVSINAVRIADIIYAHNVELAFAFNTYPTKELVKTHLLNAKKIDSTTNTGEALGYARTVFSSPNQGSRADVKKVAVLVTDGRSDNTSDTKAKAMQLKNSGVTVFAVGVGSYLLDELKAVASDPICSHVLTLTGFDKITSIIAEIQKDACEANYKATGDRPVVGQIAEGGTEMTLEFPAPRPNSTIEGQVSCGILNIYTSLTDPKPGPAVFDQMHVATPDSPALLRLEQLLPQGTLVYITVVGTRLPSSVAALKKCSDYSWSVGPVSKPNVKVMCEENGQTRLCRDQDIINAGMCRKSDGWSNLVDNPCTSKNLDKGLIFHPYPYDPLKFLQCDQQGNYYITQCPGGVTFNAQTRKCGFTSPGVSPLLKNDGEESGSSMCSFEILAKTPNKRYPYPGDNTKYLLCQIWGPALVVSCPIPKQWSQSRLACI